MKLQRHLEARCYRRQPISGIWFSVLRRIFGFGELSTVSRLPSSLEVNPVSAGDFQKCQPLGLQKGVISFHDVSTIDSYAFCIRDHGIHLACREPQATDAAG